MWWCSSSRILHLVHCLTEQRVRAGVAARTRVGTLAWNHVSEADHWLAPDEWGLSPHRDWATAICFGTYSGVGVGDFPIAHPIAVKMTEFRTTGVCVGACAVLWKTPGRFDAVTYATVCSVTEESFEYRVDNTQQVLSASQHQHWGLSASLPCRLLERSAPTPVSYTHLTLPTIYSV